MADYDIVIRNGQVVDGTGKDKFSADVAIKGDRIAMKASQGVTTVICGNCGVSASPYLRSDIGHFLSLIVKKKENVSRDFAEFAGKVDAAKPAINGAFLIGHGTLRMNAMGDDIGRTATPAEIVVMRDLLDQSLEQGAIGMSSGLFYPVAMAATTDEVAEIAKPLGKWGGVYTAHMRDESEDILKSMDETFEIGRRAGASIIVSHHKCAGRSNFGRMKETLPKFTEAMKSQEISFDVYPYVAGSTILRKDMLDHADKVLITWSDTVQGVSGRDLRDIAKEMACSIYDAADRLQPAGAIYFLMDEKDSRDLKLFPIEDAVRRMSSYSAQRFGLTKRGEVKPGFYADICVFDPATVIDTATFDAPIQPAKGIDTVLCNGGIVWQDGKPGGARLGRVLKRQDMQAEAKT